MGERLLAVQHALNPLHIYCRLLDRGIGSGLSEAICRMYEALIFTWVHWILKTFTVHRLRGFAQIQTDNKKGMDYHTLISG